MAPGTRQLVGAAGEQWAARWYERAGYQILDRNWRCDIGEIDLVCRRGRTLVVCEVKVRSTGRYGVAAEAVTATKQRRLRRLAVRWLAAHPYRPAYDAVRFDVAAVGPRGIEVLEGAF